MGGYSNLMKTIFSEVNFHCCFIETDFDQWRQLTVPHLSPSLPAQNPWMVQHLQFRENIYKLWFLIGFLTIVHFYYYHKSDAHNLAFHGLAVLYLFYWCILIFFGLIKCKFVFKLTFIILSFKVNLKIYGQPNCILLLLVIGKCICYKFRFV